MQRQIGVARSAFLPNLYYRDGVWPIQWFPLLEGGGHPPFSHFLITQANLQSTAKGNSGAAEQRARSKALDG